MTQDSMLGRLLGLTLDNAAFGLHSHNGAGRKEPLGVPTVISYRFWRRVEKRQFPPELFFGYPTCLRWLEGLGVLWI